MTRLTSPYTTKQNVYKGVIHCHSNNSDGLQTPEFVANYYKNKGCDFLSITEHTPDNHDSTTTQTTDPGIEDLLFIQGCEYGYADSTPHQHVVELKNRPLTEIITSLESGTLLNEDTQDELDAAKEYGSYTILCHPSSASREFTYQQLRSMNNYNAISIFNSGVWTDKYVDTALSTGHRVHIVTEDDAHYYDGREGYEGVSFVYVFADECTEDEIMENLFNGNFYSAMCPNGDIGMGITVDDGTITVDLDQSGRVMFHGRSGELLDWDDGTSVSYTPKYNYKTPYVRVSVNTLNPNYRVAYSNPIWVEGTTKQLNGILLYE